MCYLFFSLSGSGKTHTMQGSDASDPGVNVRSLNTLFETIAERRSATDDSNNSSSKSVVGVTTTHRVDSVYTVRISLLEIYNDGKLQQQQQLQQQLLLYLWQASTVMHMLRLTHALHTH